MPRPTEAAPTEPTGPENLGTRLRHLLELLDGGVTETYRDLGLPGFRPRYTPAIRALHEHGPMPVRDLARRLGVTHSAASQTAAQLAKDGLVAASPGTDDARQRVFRLTAEGEATLPVIAAELRATTAAVHRLDAELPCPLATVVDAALAALTATPMPARIRAEHTG